MSEAKQTKRPAHKQHNAARALACWLTPVAGLVVALVLLALSGWTSALLAVAGTIVLCFVQFFLLLRKGKKAVQQFKANPFASLLGDDQNTGGFPRL